MNFKILLISTFICCKTVFTTELSINRAEKYCAIEKFHVLRSFLAKDIFYGYEMGLKCDIEDLNFTLDIESFKAIEKNIKKYQNQKKKLAYVEFNWLKKSSFLLTKHFNISAFMNLFNNFNAYSRVNFRNLNNIEIDLFDEAFYSIGEIFLINSDLRYTIDGKTVKTCSDITSARNGTFKISSLFQIPLIKRREFFLFGCRFSLTICPFIFKNSNIKVFRVFHLTETFYKTNLIKFTTGNETISNNLNSTIIYLHLFQSENIALDKKFLNRFVFKQLKFIEVRCFLSSISIDLFSSLENLYQITFKTTHFRKLIHRNGIEWIRGINRDRRHVNLNNLTDFINNSEFIKYLILDTTKDDHIEPLYDVFPEEDFCIYKDYPFQQMVFTFQYCKFCPKNDSFGYLKKLNPSYSCTYLWINQYNHLFISISRQSDVAMSNLFFLLNSNAYKNIKSCDFTRRIALCNKSAYHLEKIWDTHDYFILNKKIQIAVKILTYLFAIFSIATNILVIRIIFAKHNKHVFKDFKHYIYLALISVFSLCISIIEIVSWPSECFYPFEVFCLGVHKTVVAQLFKMIVKECIVTTLRFLSNFCYIAFAINRIGLIGRDHGKLIKFMTKLTIWKYVLFSLILSVAFSWIKYFKYSINFGLGESNYPIWNERDIATPSASLPSILDFYMIFNVISDLLNYLVFLIVCFVVDLSMLVRLRSTVNESIERIKSNEKQFEKKKSESEDTMRKSIRMVVLNTSIGLLFKLPLVFLPLVNTIANFFYKDIETRHYNLKFDRFYTQLFDADFYSLVQDSTELFYLISLSIQYFIYKEFDKKFKEGTFSPLKNKSLQK